MNPKSVRIVFALLATANVVGQALANEKLILYTKPLLMPLLMFYIYLSAKGNMTINRLLLAVALIFSWGGDLALMNDDYFLAGVGLFFLAQITYIFVFTKSVFQQIRPQLVPVAPYILYGAFLFYVLLPDAGSLQISVVIYGLSLMGMAAFARLRNGFTSEDSFRLTALGSVLFLASDSILALNKFSFEIPMAGVWIMATYCAAQYLIVEGVLRHPS